MYKIKEVQQFCNQDLKSTIYYKNNIISVGRCPEIFIYNLDTKETKSVNTNFDSIASGIIHDDKLIIGTQTGTIIIYSHILDEPIPVYVAGHTGCVCSLDVHDHFLLSASWDGTIRMWDLNDFRLLKVFNCNVCVWQARFLKKNIGVYSSIDFYAGSANKTIELYKDGKVDKTLNMHLSAVRGVLVHDNYLYSIENEGRLMKAGIEGKLLRTVNLNDFLFCLNIKDDKIYVAGENGILAICDIDLNVLWRTKCEAQSCWNIALHEDIIYVSGSDGKVMTFEEGEDTIQEEGGVDAYKLKDKNYKVENSKAYYCIDGKWELVGDVVEDNYDHSFSVEVDGKYMKLSFNDKDDVYSVADKFISDNDLSKDYRDDIVEYIRKNFSHKENLFLYKKISVEGIKKYLKDEIILENLVNPDSKNSKEVEGRLIELLKVKDNFYVIDCYRYLYCHDYDFDLTFLQDIPTDDKKTGTVFLRLVCNMYKKLPYNLAILENKIDKIIDRKLADETTIDNYKKNKCIHEK